MYVYKITNNINQKAYIGITNNYKKRWSNECTNPKSSERQQVITRAIAKYGKNNFTFEILHSGLSIEEAIQQERDYIILYNTLVPNGYNVDPGGHLFPHPQPQLGEKNGRALLTDAEAQYIKDHRNLPMYELYEEFNTKISYDQFKKCYKHQTYTHLPVTVDEYPYNFEYSCQFAGGVLEYDEVIDVRQRYAAGEYWKEVYKDYEDRFTHEMSFWRLYNGLSYKLVMPEVFNEINKKKHSAFKNSGENNGRAKLTKEDVLKIRALHDEGMPNTEIYKLYPQVTPTSIRDIINFKTWKNIL